MTVLILFVLIFAFCILVFIGYKTFTEYRVLKKFEKMVDLSREELRKEFLKSAEELKQQGENDEGEFSN
ncbi:MAG: hypothetical protein ACI4R8_01255 [Candidatus Caccovivens sp.]